MPPSTLKLVTSIRFGDFVSDAVAVGEVVGPPPAVLNDPVDARDNAWPGSWTLLHADSDEMTALYVVRS